MHKPGDIVVLKASVVLAWHFITDKGHHHMVEADGQAIMFRGHSTTELVCVIAVSASTD